MWIDDDRLELTRQLYGLLIDYWHDVDTNWGRKAPEFYTEDAEFVGSKNTYASKAKIRAFYKWRQDRGDRTAVHSVQNFRAEFDGSSTRAVCHWFLFLHAADGRPVHASKPPISISSMTDRLVRDGGGWLVCHRRFETWFAGGIASTNPNLDLDPDLDRS